MVEIDDLVFFQAVQRTYLLNPSKPEAAEDYR